MVKKDSDNQIDVPNKPFEDTSPTPEEVKEANSEDRDSKKNPGQ